MKAGKISEVQLKRSVLQWLPANHESVIQSSGIGCDYGAFCLQDGGQLLTAMATTSVATREPEKYAFWKALNKLETGGACATGILVNIVLPARGNERRIREITERLSALCGRYHVSILGGHTELLEELRTPLITVIAFGERNDTTYSIHHVKAGDSILMLGFSAMETTAMLVGDHWTELNTRYSDSYLETAKRVGADLSLHPILKALCGQSVSYIHDLSTGGVFAALWELGEGTGCGMEVFLKEIPIRQETIEVCEFFDINPYMALSGGAALAVTPDPDPLLEHLRTLGISARKIGQMTSHNDRIVIHDEETRYLTPPKGDEIYKIYRN